MAPTDLATLALEGLYLTALLSLPVVGASFLGSILAAIGHSMLGIREVGMFSMPRVLLVLLALALASPWIGGELASFTASLWALFP